MVANWRPQKEEQELQNETHIKAASNHPAREKGKKQSHHPTHTECCSVTPVGLGLQG